MVLAIIPARKGSKSIKNKNMVELGGVPLIHWTLRAASEARCVDKIVLTTDCTKIADYCSERFSVQVILRDKELATDTASSVDVVLDVLRKTKTFDSDIVFLQPTSPFRNATDIDSAYKKFIEGKRIPFVSVVSGENQGAKTLKKIDSIFLEKNENFFEGRRQELSKQLLINGAIYFFKSEFIERNKTFFSQKMSYFEMPILRSLDLDTYDDLVIARGIWSSICPLT